jgi:hypothetical protein
VTAPQHVNSEMFPKNLFGPQIRHALPAKAAANKSIL